METGQRESLYVCVCVCEREREIDWKEKGKGGGKGKRKREREMERESEKEREREWERETTSEIPFSHIFIFAVSRLTNPVRPRHTRCRQGSHRIIRPSRSGTAAATSINCCIATDRAHIEAERQGGSKTTSCICEG